MRLFSNIRTILLAGGAAFALAACTQGDEISSPGPSNPGTPPGGNPGPGPGPGPSTDTCPAGFATGTSAGGLTVCNISGTILSNFTLPFSDSNGDGVGVAYRLNGRIDVGVDRGATGTGGTPATLTVAPGVVVFGTSGSDYIVVNRGSRIIADGAESNPIIFTSQADLERQADSDPMNDAGGSNISEWGGLVVLGRAPINRCFGGGTPGTNGCQNTVEGVTNPEAQYGGDFAADNNGVLRYIQVRFAGFPLSSGNELNGITFAGTGSATVVDFVQVHNNADDGIEMFGGTTNLKHIVLTGNDDESLDTDNGWSGQVQYLVISQRTDGGDNGMEMSSANVGVALPTNPTIANFTMVTHRSNAFRINTGHIGRFLNGVVVHDSSAECIEWASTAGDGTSAAYGGVNVDPTFNSVLFDCSVGLAEGATPAALASVAADPNNLQAMDTLSASFFPGMTEQGVTAFDLTTLPGTFFEDTNYIGAFRPDESPTNNWATGWTFFLFPDPTCPTGTTKTGEKDGVNVCSIAGVQTVDRTLTRGNYYELEGRVDIGVDAGATGAGGNPADLTIEAGVTIFGNGGSDHLVVNRGSHIFANGTSQNPIIFTSEGDIDDPSRTDTNNISEWGGVVVLGRAPINRCFGGGTPGTNGCQNTIEGVTNPEAQYGGDFAADNSGSITYTQIKFAGFPLSSGNELNGLTMGGTGSGTVVEYVQVHNNADDGIEMFGGTTNLKHIVLTGNDDESLDTDNGWSGFVQFVLIVQRALGGDNGMEMSSANVGVALPTNPTIANFTMVTSHSNAFRINTGHIGRFLNGVVTHTGGAECIEWASTAGNGTSATYDGLGVDPTFNSVLFDCNGANLAETNTAAAIASVAADANNNAAFSDTLINTFINGPSETTAAEFTPLSGINAFFEDTDYVGAVKDTNDRWWADWSCGLESSTPC